MINKSLDKVIKNIQSLDKLKNVKYVFSYITIGDTLSDIKADVIDNLSEDIPSKALMRVIDEK